MIKGFIDGYAIQPCAQARVASESVYCGPCLQEGVLENVVGIVVLEDHATDVGIERLLELAYHFGESSFACKSLLELLY